MGGREKGEGRREKGERRGHWERVSKADTVTNALRRHMRINGGAGYADMPALRRQAERGNKPEATREGAPVVQLLAVNAAKRGQGRLGASLAWPW